jgi:membrane protein YqaA with SNARE-associated domain
MSRLTEWIQAAAGGLGAPGLALLAFADSSFISLPEVADVLLIVRVIQDPARWWYYGVMVTAGSVAGCFVLYELARRGGETFVKKRFSAATVQKSVRWFERYGMLVIILPSIMPPPVPLKIFLLLAGVSGMSRIRFLLAITAGRALRYVGEALLAVWYGRDALRLVQENLGRVGLVLSVAAIVAGLIWWWRRRGPVAPVVD